MSSTGLARNHGIYVFRLTYWMPMEQILKWYDWLEGRGVPVAIVGNKDRADFSLWRGPWMANLRGGKIGSHPELWDPGYQIRMEANGFSDCPMMIKT